MEVDEMTCAASGFAISGFGTPVMFSVLEQNMLENVNSFTADNIKELCRAFIFSKRGSKTIHQLLMPRI